MNVKILDHYLMRYVIDKRLLRTYFLYDVKNNKGHDVVYYSNNNDIIMEGECLGDGIIDGIND